MAEVSQLELAQWVDLHKVGGVKSNLVVVHSSMTRVAWKVS